MSTKIFHQLGAVLGPVAAAFAASADAPAWMRGAGAGLGALVALLAVLEKAWGPKGPPPLALLLLLLPLAACAPRGSNPITVRSVVSCGTDAVKSCGTTAFGDVVGCLDGDGDVSACMLGLVRTGAACLAFDVVACVARGNAEPSVALGLVGPSPLEQRRAARAREFLAREGVIFDDGR